MAIRALNNPCVASGDGKTGGGVIKGRRLPGGCSMAGGTNYRKAGGNVVRNLRGSIFSCMTSVAVGRGVRETIGVALGALSGRVYSCQREYRGRMVKVRIQPVVLIVAHLAVCRIHQGFVILCPVILNLMTSDTSGLCVQYTSFMAVRTLNNCRMAAGQGKTSGGVIKGRRLPGGCIVAGGTENRNSGSNMVRNLGRSIFSCMAGVAVGRGIRETSGVALGTLSGGVNSGESKSG